MLILPEFHSVSLVWSRCVWEAEFGVAPTSLGWWCTLFIICRVMWPWKWGTGKCMRCVCWACFFFLSLYIMYSLFPVPYEAACTDWILEGGLCFLCVSVVVFHEYIHACDTCTLWICTDWVLEGGPCFLCVSAVVFRFFPITKWVELYSKDKQHQEKECFFGSSISRKM